MIEFLQTDIAGTPTYSMNPNILGEVQQFLRNFLDLDLDKRYLSTMNLGQASNNCNLSHQYSIFNFYNDDVSTFWKAQVLGINH